MIQALLSACLWLQTQVAEPVVRPEVLTLLQAGVDAETHNQIDQAIVDFRKAADLAPSTGTVFLRLGNAYMKKRDYGSAISSSKRAVELDPDSIPAHQLLGFALLSEGYASEAIPHLQMAHEFGTLGIAQLQVGQPAEAVGNLKIALEKTPDDPDLLYYLSRAGAALSSEARDRLISSFGQSARAHQVLGQNDYAMKMLPEAVTEYRQAIDLRPDLPGLHLELGEIYSASSEWAKAEEQFRAETKLQRGNAEAAYRLGSVLSQEGKTKEAAEELRRSDLLRPDMPETLYALARASMTVDLSAAENALDRVVTLERETPLAAQAYLLLAAIHRKQGNIDAAVRDMQNYRRLQILTSKSRE
jgi:tetratricopeptide (TPR) repeat protein